MRDIKRIRHRVSPRGRKAATILHIETNLGIINIQVGLSDAAGRRVESIEIIPDFGVTLDGYRLVETGGGDASTTR